MASARFQYLDYRAHGRLMIREQVRCSFDRWKLRQAAGFAAANTRPRKTVAPTEFTQATTRSLVHTVLGIPGALLLANVDYLAYVVGVVGTDVREYLG
jgi:hypothetical protein